MRMQRILFPLGAAVLFAVAGWGGAAQRQPGPAQQPPAPPAASASAAYVGSDVCTACHGEVADHLAKTPHGKGGFARLSNLGCETCHGPGARTRKTRTTRLSIPEWTS